MSTFQDLPNEVILQIVKLSAVIPITVRWYHVKFCKDTDTLSKLRLVSRRLNTIVYPFLFAELSLGFSDTDTSEQDAPDYVRCRDIIIALATRSTILFERTKVLCICAQKLYWTKDNHREGVSETQKLVVDKIFHAVSVLKSLRAVRYFCNPTHEPEQLATEVIRGLSTLPFFEHLDLHFITPPPPSFTLKPLSNLTVFRALLNWDKPGPLVPEIASLLARCSNLSEVYLNGVFTSTNECVSLREFFFEVRKMEGTLKLKTLRLYRVLVTLDDIEANIRHLKHLTALEIVADPGALVTSNFGAICNILQQNDIFLSCVSTDASDPLILSYLSSYSGITELHLYGRVGFEDFEVANEVYTQVLPKHSDTLEDLSLGSTESRVWCKPPTDEQIAQLVKCQKLRRLEIHSIANPTGLESSDRSVIEKWCEIGLQFPNLLRLKVLPRFGTPSQRAKSVWWKAAGEVTARYHSERGMKFRVSSYQFESRPM